MDIEEIKRRIQKIEAAKGDNEGAHAMEDGLAFDFVRFVADGRYGELSEMAKELLKVEDIDYCRWYA